jgi:hypothetical protein
MANDAFMKPEIPESLRDLMKMSIEQAKRAFDMFASTSEKAWKSLETTSQSGRSGLHALNAKIADITRSNAEANFALALKLAESKDFNQAMGAAEPARAEADGGFRASVGRDARPRRADHPGGEPAARRDDALECAQAEPLAVT